MADGRRLWFIEHKTRDELLNDVWGYNAMPVTRTCMSTSRGCGQKIEANPKHPRYIQTIHGLGYRFVG